LADSNCLASLPWREEISREIWSAPAGNEQIALDNNKSKTGKSFALRLSASTHMKLTLRYP
jgi:hypothetical protein